jgi:hypothetical protein
LGWIGPRKEEAGNFGGLEIGHINNGAGRAQSANVTFGFFRHVNSEYSRERHRERKALRAGFFMSELGSSDPLKKRTTKAAGLKARRYT